MKEVYKVAENVFSVSAPDGLPAWTAIRRRFRPFAAGEGENPALEVTVASEALPECDAERIYEPVAGAWIIEALASRLRDGSLVMDFRHVEESNTRLRMKMPPLLDRAEITIAPDGDDDDPYFLAHALMIAYMLATSRNGTLMIHASSVIYDGEAYLFQGKSGTGKSTHAGLWTKNIDGAELLNDDNPVVRFSADGRGVAYGSPWSGKTHCYRNVSAPIGGFVRIVRAADNALHRLAPLRAYASLTTSVFFMPFMGEELKETRHKTIERLAATVGCYEMHCRPDADAALTCMRGVRGISEEVLGK